MIVPSPRTVARVSSFVRLWQRSMRLDEFQATGKKAGTPEQRKKLASKLRAERKGS